MTDPMIKLYAGLSPAELAVLDYRYLMRGEAGDLERARIESVMIEECFISLPMTFRRTAYNLHGLAMIYAVTYWQNVARCLSLLARLQALFSDPDLEAYKPINQRLEAAEAALLAIERAFDSVCADHGLDAAVMRVIAGKQFYEIATPDLKPDDVCLAGYREIFAAIML